MLVQSLNYRVRTLLAALGSNQRFVYVQRFHTAVVFILKPPPSTPSLLTWLLNYFVKYPCIRPVTEFEAVIQACANGITTVTQTIEFKAATNVGNIGYFNA